MPDPPSPIELSLLATAVALVGLVALSLWCLRLASRLRELRRRLEECWQDVSMLRGAVLGLVEDQRRGGRQEEFDARLRELKDRQEQLMQRDSETGRYVQAVRHAQQGASVDDLMSSHGLARGEAELIRRLHGPARGTERRSD